MITTAFLIVLTLLAVYAGSFIRKHNVKFYVGALLLSILSFIFKDLFFAMPFIKGFLGLAFFYLVMLAGALKNKTKLRVKLMGVRKEYSIIGSIVVTPHALNYTLLWLNGTRSIEWFGLVAYVIMIPLFVTSFVVIRKKMKNKDWKLLQSSAYIVYLLLFIHLILNYTKKINLILYLAMFLAYFGMKLLFEVNKYKSKRAKKNH